MNNEYLRAEDKFTNVISQKLFEKLSYEKYLRDEYIEYIKPVNKILH